MEIYELLDRKFKTMVIKALILLRKVMHEQSEDSQK